MINCEEKKNSKSILTQRFDVAMTSLSSDKIIILKFYINLYKLE